MTEQVTDKMVSAAAIAFAKKAWGASIEWETTDELKANVRAALEAALAAREPVDAGVLVEGLRQISLWVYNQTVDIGDIDWEYLDHAADALETQAREISDLAVELDNSRDKRREDAA